MVDKILKPFDIVSAPYVDLNGNVKTFENGDEQRGLFLVLAVDYDNMLCAKITSQVNHSYLAHSVCITKAANYFLRTDSYVQLDKLHTISVYSATYIGYVDLASHYAILNVLRGFFSSVSQNLKRFCPRRKPYFSPNFKKI